jgi:large subunit ribosomal protein L20
MARVKRSVAAHKKRRKTLEQAKGYWGLKKSSYRRAKEQLIKSGTYAYRDRRAKKREFRRLWITRINAAAREQGMSYNQLIHGLKLAEIEIDRKMLADLAVKEPEVFAQMATRAKQALGAGGSPASAA